MAEFAHPYLTRVSPTVAPYTQPIVMDHLGLLEPSPSIRDSSNIMTSNIALEDGTWAKRRPIVLSGSALALMCFQTLGIIYSDIGTSPLYVLNGIWSSSGAVPSKEDVIGGISAIIWSLTILPLTKYVLICLRFGTTEGEGGTFALLNGLYPSERHEDDDRTLTSDSGVNGSAKTDIRGRTFLTRMKWPLRFWSLFGTALTLSDGIFTPAVSVTSAVGGLAIAKPSVQHQVTPIAIAFLIGLFLVQRFGTARITSIFAPITFGWLLLLAGTGIYNITQFPGVFRAVDPSRAIMWFVRTKEYDHLAGVLLAMTGCEAMFANLGQFNRLSIQLSFSLFVYPCLLLAYLGQGARLITDGAGVMDNIFFLTIPGPQRGPLYWIIYVFSILATLIASQALITATFSLTQQLINMKSLPPLRLIYTSSSVQGQIYVPAANYILFIATIIVVGVFKDLASMTNAYGFAVATVMIVTTSFIAIQIYAVKFLPIGFSVLFFLVFGFFDGLFFGACLRKVPHGAWVPLAIGSVLTGLMVFWTWAKGLEDRFDGENRKNPRHFIVKPEITLDNKTVVNEDEKGEETLDGEDIVEAATSLPNGVVFEDRKESSKTEFSSDQLLFLDDATRSTMELVRLPTCAVFLKLTAGRGVPHSFYAFLKKMPALPRIVIFLSVRVVPVAHVNSEDTYVLTKVRSIPGFYGVTYRLGFREDFNPSISEIIRLICEIEERANSIDAQKIIAEIRSVATRTSHIIPHYVVVSKGAKGYGWATPIAQMIRRFLIEDIYLRLSTMFPETANWALDNEEILRVGVNAPI